MSVLVLMEVSGAGKSTVGRLLATRLGWRFADADDHHPPANREKMARGVPLEASDREAWLAGLAERIRGGLDAGQPVVIACSALARASRRTLRVDPTRVRFVHLVGPPGLIRERLRGRTDHFMPPDLLERQLDALEAPGPREALAVPVDQPPEAIAERIARSVERKPGSCALLGERVSVTARRGPAGRGRGPRRRARSPPRWGSRRQAARPS